MDEVPVYFDIPDSRIVEEKGKKDILLSTTGSEKLRFTVVLCTTAGGDKLKPMVIFKRKTKPPGQFEEDTDLDETINNYVENLEFNSDEDFNGFE